MADQRTTWRDPRRAITHGVTVFDMSAVDFDVRTAQEIRTDCGLQLSEVTLHDDARVTCAFCLEGDWLEEVAGNLTNDRYAMDDAFGIWC